MKSFFLLLGAAFLSSNVVAQQNHKTETYDSTHVHRRIATDSTNYQRGNASPKSPDNTNTGPDVNNADKWFLGLRVLPTLTSLEYNNPSNGVLSTTFVLGWGFSGQLGVNLSHHAALEGEVLYESLAQQYKEGNMVRTVHLNYLNIPLMFLLQTDYTKPVSFNVAFGPQFGIFCKDHLLKLMLHI